MAGMEGDAFLNPSYQPGKRTGDPRKYPDTGASSGSSRPVSPLQVVLPWLMFTLIVMLFTYGYHHIPALVWVTAALCGCFACIFMFTSGGDQEGRASVVLGVLCSFSILLAILGGLANYTWNMAPYWAYEESREYRNVLPSEAAAAHADAGKIFFAEAARIDTTKAVGFKAGSTYCVAPILDPSSTTRVEFWAVGMDCCAERGDFQCGDATAEGTAAAHAGVVVMDNRFLNGVSHFEYFAKAVKEAEAANDLVSAKDPLYLYWVKDPEAVQSSLFAKGTSSFLLYSGLYLLFNANFAFLASKLPGRKRAY